MINQSINQFSKCSCDDNSWNNRPSQHTVGLGYWCLTPLSAIFQLYRGSQEMREGVGQSGQRIMIATEKIWRVE
jgi:hypothetical protein